MKFVITFIAHNEDPATASTPQTDYRNQTTIALEAANAVAAINTASSSTAFHSLPENVDTVICQKSVL